MPLTGLDLCLASTTIAVVLLDIVLALGLRFILPPHITQTGYYPADGRKLTYDEAVRFCPCLARVFPDGTKDLITFSRVDENVVRRRRQAEEEEEDGDDAQDPAPPHPYPFLVSLSIPAYSDTPEQQIFACNGLVQSLRHLLTTRVCVKNESEWYNLTVRSGSPYWSQLGREHDVVNVTYIDDHVVALEVFPPFAESLLPRPPIKYPPAEGDWVHAVTLGWDDRMYEKTIDFRYKYKEFEVERWTSRPCASENRDVCHGGKRCELVSSRPLLTSCHQLIGMKYGEDGAECDKFAAMGKSTANYVNGSEEGGEECYKINKDTCPSVEVDVC